MRQVFFNPEAQRVSFLDSRFYACNDKPAVYVPSATTILDVAPKGPGFYDFLKRFGKDADTYMMERMEVGSNVHNMTEIFDKTGELQLATNGTFNLRLEEVRMIYRYIDFVERFKPEMEFIEMAYAHSALGFGGTLDRRLKIRGERWLLDIKTGNIYDYYLQQLAAYVLLNNTFNPNEPIDRVGILHLAAKTRTNGKGDAIQGEGWQLIEMPAKVGERPGLEYHTELFMMYRHIWNHANPNFEPDSPMFDTYIKRSYDMPTIVNAELPGPDNQPFNF